MYVPKLAISQAEGDDDAISSHCTDTAGFMAEFGYDKYPVASFWYSSAAYQTLLVSPWVFLARLRLNKIQTMGRPKSRDIPAKLTKKANSREGELRRGG